MKFRIKFAEQVIGLFILLSIIFLAVILIFMGINQRWFRNDYSYISKFQSGSGLGRGVSISLKGFKIGEVKSRRLNPDNTVSVNFVIFEEFYTKVRPNSVIELASNPLGLGGGLIFHTGKGAGKPLPENSFIPSLDFEEGRQLVANNMVNMPAKDDEVTQLIGKVGPIMDNVNELLENVNGITAGTAKGPVSTIVKNLAVTSYELNVLLGEIKGIAAHANTASAKLNDDPSAFISSILSEDSSINSLIYDDNKLYERIDTMLDDIERTMSELRGFSEYINDTTPQIAGLLEKSKDTLDEGKDVLEALKNNPLLKGGVTPSREQQTTFQSYRDEDF